MMRGMLRSIDHSSTLTMVHTAMRAPSGKPERRAIDDGGYGIGLSAASSPRIVSGEEAHLERPFE